MNLYVIRHGKTDWNLESRIQGKTNISLNEMGMNQAEEVRKKIEEKDIDLIIASPLDRTKQTAEIINKNMQVPIKYHENLMERNFGIYEGKDAKTVDVWKDLLKYHDNVAVENGEKIQEFFGRVFDCMSDIEKENKDKNVLIVTHGGVARAIDCYFNGIPEDNEDTGSMLSNCEVREYNL